MTGPASILLALSVGASASADDLFVRAAEILSARCLDCHNGIDREGGHSFESAGDALRAVEPGKPSESLLLKVVVPIDGVADMPDGREALPAEEIEALAAWIEAGAPWPEGTTLAEPVVDDFDWWSYRPIEMPEIPSSASAWVRTPVDAFVLENLEAHGLEPAPEADRRTLVRRLSHDLVGLPPTPEEVEAFESDDEPAAYERLVDRLLESPRYGERWARHWLDVVQYADTCGYDKDKLRPNAWPYRDYVVRAFNEDKPYARFIREQIAGDILFPGEPDGVVALGFLAAGPWDFIGHVEVPESKVDGLVARNLDRDDMVANTFNTFASTTVQCARCHQHKFDPVSMEDYYGLQSIFAAVDRAERAYDLDPEVERTRQRLEDAIEASRRIVASIEREIEDEAGPRLAEIESAIDGLESAVRVEKDERFGYHSAISSGPEVEKWVRVDLPEAIEIETIVLRPCHDEFAGIGAGFGFPLRYRVEVSTDGDDWITVADRTDADQPNPGLAEVRIDHGAIAAQHVRVTATRLAERDGDHVFALAELEVIDRSGRGRTVGADVVALDSIEAPRRWGRSNLVDGAWPTWTDADAAERLGGFVAERDDLRRSVETPARRIARDEAVAAIAGATAEIQSLPTGRMVYAVATDFAAEGHFKPTGGTPRRVRILHRGEVTQPLGDAVPGVPALREEDPDRWSPELAEGDRRARLADWLASPEHPLVWRSIVNRVWLHHFGEGLVSTPNDFGRMGGTPSHPALLDWLAATFRDGQSFKDLHRLIVTSSTYRQSSRHDPVAAATDGGNRLLWRMNRRRLDAESIRDGMLAASGALDLTMGGPGYRLFELERTEHSPHYEYHAFDPADPATHRRSIYRFVVRSQPDPWMSTLDCADSSQSTPRRHETLTALQALTLLNSRFNTTMAERLAERLRRERDDPGERIDHAIRILLQRPATPEERRSLLAYASEHGLANTCRLLFNLNEFIFVD